MTAKTKRFWATLLLAVGLLSLLLIRMRPLPNVVAAQSDWDRMRLLDPAGAEPIVLADRQGDIHYLWENDGYIMYAHKTNGSASLISGVVDIIETSSPSFDAAISDETMHIIFLRGTELYHTRAHVAEANNSAKWQDPVLIDSANGTTSPSMAVNENGDLYVSYITLNNTQRAVKFAFSSEGNDIWSNPITISEFTPTAEAPDNPHVFVDGSGIINIAWETDEYPDAWPPTGIFYTRSLDNGSTWQEPYRIADGLFMFPRIGVDGTGAYFLVWSGTDVQTGRYNTVSFDQGETWSATQELGSSLASRTGEDRLVLDGDGDMHWVIGGGTAIYHAEYQDGDWVLDSFQATCSERPGAAIALGHNLVVAWQDRCDGGTFYSSKTLDATNLDPIPITVPQPNVADQPEDNPHNNVAQPQSTAETLETNPSSKLPDHLLTQEPSQLPNLNRVLLLSSIISLFVVIIVLVFIRARM